MRALCFEDYATEASFCALTNTLFFHDIKFDRKRVAIAFEMLMNDSIAMDRGMMRKSQSDAVHFS